MHASRAPRVERKQPRPFVRVSGTSNERRRRRQKRRRATTTARARNVLEGGRSDAPSEREDGRAFRAGRACAARGLWHLSSVEITDYGADGAGGHRRAPGDRNRSTFTSTSNFSFVSTLASPIVIDRKARSKSPRVASFPPRKAFLVARESWGPSVRSDLREPATDASLASRPRILARSRHSRSLPLFRRWRRTVGIRTRRRWW